MLKKPQKYVFKAHEVQKNQFLIWVVCGTFWKIYFIPFGSKLGKLCGSSWTFLRGTVQSALIFQFVYSYQWYESQIFLYG